VTPRMHAHTHARMHAHTHARTHSRTHARTPHTPPTHPPTQAAIGQVGIADDLNKVCCLIGCWGLTMLVLCVGHSWFHYRGHGPLLARTLDRRGLTLGRRGMGPPIISASKLGSSVRIAFAAS
jgi:hypothetical protein